MCLPGTSTKAGTNRKAKEQHRHVGPVVTDKGSTPRSQQNVLELVPADPVVVLVPTCPEIAEEL